MRIRRVDIDHFRGINAMTWHVPDRGFISLVGPGDATKSTVLTALERALSDRWNITFHDTDFHGGDSTSPISIRVALADLDDTLITDDVFGRHLCGISDAGELTHDPENTGDRCVVIELRVESDLEPQWLFWRPSIGGDGPIEQPQPVKASLRSRLGVYRVDERVDVHLRWSRMSALGKLTEARHDAKGVLTEASRAARRAVAEHATTELVELSGEIQVAVERMGSAKFNQLRPGLDLSLTNAQGNLALYDGAVPLMNYGLGTRRLAGAATQQLAHAGSAVLLVDEVEYGLEPHRLVHLLRQLRNADAYAQVFVTTHSPTALQHLDAADLVTVRSDHGTTTLRSLADPADLQGVVRSTPAAFLSRRVLVCEGKTEVGLLTGKLTEWDNSPSCLAPSAAFGVTVVDGESGGKAVRRARHLLAAGFEVVLFIDSDVQADVDAAEQFATAGGVVIRWDDNLNTEAAICAELSVDGLTALIKLAVELNDDPDTAIAAVGDQLVSRGAPSTDHNVASWVSTGCSVEQARDIVARTAAGSGWFKMVAKGQRLATFLSGREELVGGSLAERFDLLHANVYQPWMPSEAPLESPPSPPTTPIDPSAA